ncbi:MAG: hypothetical protein HY959_13410 [Ignavibacteriae bacterium]|nr:hypothetical protein [Ignavibacteriota bacterium]
MNFILNDLPAELSNHRNKLINKLKIASEDYEEKRSQLIYFEGISVTMKLISDNSTSLNILNISKETIDGFKKMKTDLEIKGKSFEMFIKEKKYVDSYQIFEDYLHECLLAFIYYFPRKSIKNLNIDELQLTDDYNDNLDLFEKSENIFIKKSIDKIIFEEFKNKFNLLTNIEDDYLLRLYYHSQNRNMLVHRYGVVDKRYLKNINDKKLKPEYKLGDLIYKKIDQELSDIELLLFDLKSKIIESFYQESFILIKNYFNKI